MLRRTVWRALGTVPPLRDRTDLLNFLIVKRGYASYLEIGVRRPWENFDLIRASVKHGVDPAAEATVTHPMTSDAFFKTLRCEQPSRRYNLIFIDGLHTDVQVERDVVNSLTCLSEHGAIVVHDCNPLTENAQSDYYDGLKRWNGTVWKAWARFRATRRDLSMLVVDLDEGCGVIVRGSQETYPLGVREYADMTFTLLDGDRVRLLNLVTSSEFARAIHRDALGMLVSKRSPHGRALVNRPRLVSARPRLWAQVIRNRLAVRTRLRRLKHRRSG